MGFNSVFKGLNEGGNEIFWRNECQLNENLRKGHALQQVWRSKQDVKLISSLHTANCVETLKKNWKVKSGARSIMLFFFHGATAPIWTGPPHLWCFTSHSDAPYAVGLLFRRHRSAAESSTWQHTTFTKEDILAIGGIRKPNRSKQAAGDLNFRSRGHRVRQSIYCKKFTWMLDRVTKWYPITLAEEIPWSWVIWGPYVTVLQMAEQRGFVFFR